MNETGPPQPYYCTKKINQIMKETVCGPIFSVFHLLSNVLEFNLDIQPAYHPNIWNNGLSNKVPANLYIYSMLTL